MACSAISIRQTQALSSTKTLVTQITIITIELKLPNNKIKILAYCGRRKLSHLPALNAFLEMVSKNIKNSKNYLYNILVKKLIILFKFILLQMTESEQPQVRMAVHRNRMLRITRSTTEPTCLGRLRIATRLFPHRAARRRQTCSCPCITTSQKILSRCGRHRCATPTPVPLDSQKSTMTH